MSIQEIKTEITRLPPQEVGTLMRWLADYDAQVWEKEIATDLEQGNLDSLLEDVDREYKAGLAKLL